MRLEPFLSRDGSTLFFNNSNDATVNTDLHYATRVDDLTFDYVGPVLGVNTTSLDAVASMARDGTFYFVSTRSYDTTASTLYRGHYQDGSVSNVELVPGVSAATPGIVEFDAEISGDGATLYYVESQFSTSGTPKTADIRVAISSVQGFNRSDSAGALLTAINTDALEYAPDISPSGRELFCTRADGKSPPQIYVATRPSTDQAFNAVFHLTLLDGFVEGPSLSPDGQKLYYHKRENGVFTIFMATRSMPDP